MSVEYKPGAVREDELYNAPQGIKFAKPGSGLRNRWVKHYSAEAIPTQQPEEKFEFILATTKVMPAKFHLGLSFKEFLWNVFIGKPKPPIDVFVYIPRPVGLGNVSNDHINTSNMAREEAIASARRRAA